MKNLIKKAMLAVPVLFFFLLNLGAQDPSVIIYRGILTDIDGNPISGKSCEITFEISAKGNTPLFSHKEKVTTDQYGVFFLTMNDISPVFNQQSNNGEVKLKVVVKQEKGEKWLEENQFDVTYYFKKEFTDKEKDYSITRFEGQVLQNRHTQPVWLFMDKYPFAYLSSTFMISFSDKIVKPEAIIDICESMMPPEMKEDEAAPDRGIKGGYAVGGYKKKD